MSCEAAARVYVSIKKHCNFGATVEVVGGGSALGEWSSSQGKTFPLTWSTNDIWRGCVDLDVG